MPDTNFLGMTFPDENDDPWFDKIAGFFTQVDAQLYGMIATNQPLMGGGVVSLAPQTVSPPTAILSWTADFEILIPGSGSYLTIPFGPDQANRSIELVDGDRVIVTIPNTSTGAVTAYINKVNGALSKTAANLQGLLTIGVYRNGIFYHNLPRTLP
jgi:hypothetical protein